MAELAKALQTDIPRHLSSPDFRAQARAIEQTYEAQEAKAFAVLEAFAQARQFRLQRSDEDGGHMVFTSQAPAASPDRSRSPRPAPEQRARIDEAEQALRAEIIAFAQTLRPLERVRDDALNDLRKRTVRPWCSKPWPPCAAPCPNKPRCCKPGCSRWNANCCSTCTGLNWRSPKDSPVTPAPTKQQPGQHAQR